MINELDVIEQVVKVIQEGLNNYLDDSYPAITDKQVVIDFPKTDKMSYSTMIYVQPSYAEYEGLTTNSDKVDFRVSIFILVKKDTKYNLTLKRFAYYNALYNLLRCNTTLDAFVDRTSINDTTFYPAVEANENVQGSESSISVIFTKDF